MDYENLQPVISLIPDASIVFLTISCEKNNNGNTTGNAEFSINLPADQTAKSTTILDSVALSYQVILSVEDLKGNPVLTDKLIPVYQFGTAFVSENIEIKTGEYKLTKFMVLILPV